MTITGYKGNGSSLVIPWKIDSGPIIAIQEHVCWDNQLIGRVTILDSAKMMGEGAFDLYGDLM